jgi:DNA repair photolyase
MISQINAKTLLSTVKQPDTWFGLSYSMNLYRGCQHQCIYCDSRSECYRIDNFSDILVKSNAIELLDTELSRKRKMGTIGTGSMNDPYMPIEDKIKLTRRALEVIARHSFPVHIITKSALVARDTDILRDISRVYAAVSFTITTASDELGKKMEPGASLVSERLVALERLSSQGILTGITMMPVLPFVEDSEENIRTIVEKAAAAGAKYIIAGFGVTLRDRQRDYFYHQLDKLFLGYSAKYRLAFGNRYFAPARNIPRLELVFKENCEKLGVRIGMPFFQPKTIGSQLSLF